MPLVLIPKHVAIIMDGNGRWAQKRNLPRIVGHEAGVKVVKDIVRFAGESGVSVLSLFAFSCENWGRPKSEIEFLMQLFLQSLEEDTGSLNENNVQLRIIGDVSILGKELQNSIIRAQEATAKNSGLILVIAINYSGQWDIAQASKKIAEQVSNNLLDSNTINYETFRKNLSFSELPDPDLFIRTSGEKRLSNFYLAQLAYTELFFCDAYWPDFTIQDFERALHEYATRERRYGTVEEGAQC